MKRYLYLLAIAVAFIATVPALNAQVAGRLSGSVVDQTGAAIPGAKIGLLLPGGTTAVLATETTAEGLFSIPTVRPDLYVLSVEASGFTRTTVSGVKVDPSKETAVPPITLEIASTSSSVEVSASTSAVQTSSVEVATTISTSQVENLPVLDRQVSNLYITQAGVTNSRTSTTINGLRPSYTNVLLDGVNIQDSVRTNAIDYMPNKLTIGQIAEMTVSASNTNPTIGGNANTISLSTASGTNNFHGNAYWYNRNSALAANDWFNNKNGVDKPFLNLNQLGGTIGGPIKKDKLFFFSNYEAYRLRQSSPTDTTILTPEAQQGIFRYRDKTGNVQSFNILQAQNLTVDPFIQNLFGMMPSVGNNSAIGDGLNYTGYSFNARSNETRDNVTGKLDYYLSTRHTFSGSYAWNRDIVDRPDMGTFFTPVPPIYNDNNGHFASASWRWAASPTLVNELRGGLNRTPGSFLRNSDLPAFFVSNSSLLFTSPINETMPESRTTNNYSIQDNANWVKGAHTVSFGFQASVWRVSMAGNTGIVPLYSVGLSSKMPYGFKAGSIPGASTTDINTANSLLASLGGLVSSASQTFNITNRTSGYVPGAGTNFQLNMNNYAPYISDTWKIRRNLTLILGLRYEYFSPVSEPNSFAIQPIADNPIVALLGNSTLDFAGGPDRPFYKRDWNNFAPNVGFAWDVFGNGRTAVRSGYSIAYANDNNINSVYNTFIVNPGLSTNITLNNLNGRVTGSLPAIATPAATIPSTLKDQFDMSPSGAPVQGLIDPNLKTPYVQQWNFGIEQQVKGLTVTARYVGNHTVGLFRQIDFNQINVNQGTFLQDFKTARNNGFLALAAGRGFDPRYNAAIAGSAPVPFFDSMPGNGYLNNSAIYPAIQRGEIGTLAQTYQSNGLFPNDSFSFFPNPYALYSSELTNFAQSTYNSGQFEVTRRLHNGLQFQANYVFAKALTNATAFRGLEALLDNSNPGIEKAPATFDLRHAFKVNHYVPLPFGPGHRFAAANKVLNGAIGGWALSGFLLWQSGPPVSILSARGTLNRGARSANNTVDTLATMDQLRAATGQIMTGNGPFFVNPANIGADGRGVAPDGSAPFSGQLFYNPQPGSLGSLQRLSLNGPQFFDYNFGIQKDTKITERQSIQFRADFYNVFNHPNFYAGDTNVNSASFGRITQMLSTGDGVTSRIIQFGLFYRF